LSKIAQLESADAGLSGTINQINNTLTSLLDRMINVENRLTAVENRISDIENIIYNYPADKVTKIPRGNMILRFSTNNGASYQYFIQAADETDSNVVRGRVN
jgi:uncharacterized coiled-coil protein SlyX